MSTIAYSKSIPVVAEPDVLVCGTGLAGLGAAVAAARQGASVWTVDRMGFAGGGLVPPLIRRAKSVAKARC